MPNQQNTTLIPASRARTDIRVSNSRFIANAAPAATIEAARAIIAEIRAEMPDATHHVYAYIIGHGATTTHGMSDDGEPSGTAGRPILSILRGSGLGDIALVVTRYFGGTLLGTGGLVRAYSDAARAVLSILPREEKIARCTLILHLPYATYESARRLIAAHTGTIVDEQFAAEIILHILIPQTETPHFCAAIIETTAGQARIENLPT